MISPEQSSRKSFEKIVISLVILSLAVFPSAACKSERALQPRVAQLQIAELEGALQLLAYDLGRYPSTTDGLDGLIISIDRTQSWKGPYVRNAKSLVDPWGRPYIYQCPGIHGAYDLYSFGRDGVEGGDGDDADITSWTDFKYTEGDWDRAVDIIRQILAVPFLIYEKHFHPNR
jgi:general secretion pathway protein G